MPRREQARSRSRSRTSRGRATARGRRGQPIAAAAARGRQRPCAAARQTPQRDTSPDDRRARRVRRRADGHDSRNVIDLTVNNRRNNIPTPAMELHDVVDLTNTPAERNQPTSQQEPIVIDTPGAASVGERSRNRVTIKRPILNPRELNLDDDDDVDTLPDLPPVPFDLSKGKKKKSPPASPKLPPETPPSKTGISCPVCFETDVSIRRDGGQLMSTICGHVFCKDCIYTAIRQQKKCPTCRKKLAKKHVHVLFV